MTKWKEYNRILCIRPDNMGDILMSAPAMSALKESFGCDLTLLTSPMGKAITPFIPCIDDVIVWEAPWVKGTSAATIEDFAHIVRIVRERQFDAAVIFTVFSQNPLPSAMVATLAGIPNRLAYCRENPYQLLTHWVPEKEPYSLLQHQVIRDLALVKTIGAKTKDEKIVLTVPATGEQALREKLERVGVDLSRPWIILHPGVSETKREYNQEKWIEAGKKIRATYGYQLIITGAEKEIPLARSIRDHIGPGTYSVAGMLDVGELIMLVRFAPLLISVNTVTVHLAAAVRTKVVVLYALTNPQHTPWKAIGKILPFSVDEQHRSSNEILRYVQQKYEGERKYIVNPDDIVKAVGELLNEGQEPPVEELVLPTVQGIRNTLNFQEP